MDFEAFTRANPYSRRKCTVKNVVDGDTVDVLIDNGLGDYREARLRLWGINTPEIRGVEREQGLIVKEWVKSKIDGKEVDMIFGKVDSFGRPLALLAMDLGPEAPWINEVLLAEGMAKVYKK